MKYVKSRIIIAAALLAACAAMCGPAGTPALAQETYAFVKAWGSSGSGDGQFNSPYGITYYDPQYVMVTDQGNHRVQKFTVSGTYMSKWGSSGSGDGQFNDPAGIYYDTGNARFYIADRDNNRVQKLTTSGTLVTKWGSSGSGEGEFNHPVGIKRMAAGIVTYGGLVYVADTDNSRVQVFHAEGDFVDEWGSAGTGNGQFAAPSGIDTDMSGYVYVADYGNNRVQKFNADGTFVSAWGSQGTGNGQFNGPFDIVIDNDGDLYVTDCNNHRVQKFTSAGTFIGTWGSSGTGNGQFQYPKGICVYDGSASGTDVFVVDSGNSRVQKFRVTIGASTTTTASGSSTTTTISGGSTTTTTSGGGSTSTTIAGGGSTTTISDDDTTTTTISGGGSTTTTTSGGGSTTTTISGGTTTTIGPGEVLADFSASPTEGYRPLTVNFVNLSRGDIATYLWNFGDGQESSQKDPVHIYSAIGTYSVVLQVFGTSGAQGSKTKDSLIKVKPWCIFLQSLDSRDAIRAMWAFRDLMLDNSYGAYLASLYYRNAEEVSSIFEQNPGLQEKFKGLVQENLAIVAGRVRTGDAAVSAAALDEAVAFLRELRAEAGPGLQIDIDIVINGIERGYIQQSLGIRVK